MEHLINWFYSDLDKTIPIASVAVGLFMGGVWTVLTFFHKFYTDREEMQFQRYRLLVEELNRGKKEENKDEWAVYVDFQLNSVYEMRFYRKYYPRSERIIEGLIPRWEKAPSYNDANVEELKATLKYIRYRKSFAGNILMKIVGLIWPWCK